MKAFARASVLASLLVVGSGATKIVNRGTSKTLVTKKLSFPSQTGLNLRGGAGPFDANAVVKVYTCLFGAQFIAENINPKKAITMFGISDKENTPVAQIIVEFMSQAIIGLCIVPVLMLFFDTSFRTAYAAGNLVEAYNALPYVLSDKLLSSGFSSNNGAKIFIVLKVLPAVAVLKDVDFADTLIKVSMAFWAIAGAQLAFAPKEAAKSWNLVAPLNPLPESLTKTIGQCYIGAVVFQAAVLLYDQPIAKAFGLSLLPYVLGNVLQLLDGSAQKTGLGINTYYLYTVVNALTIAATVL